VNGLITEGIPLGIPTQILTSGLFAAEAPIPPHVPSGGASLSGGISYLILDDVDGPAESSIFALQSDVTKLTWELTGSVSDADLEGSLDATHFAIIDSASAAGVRTIFTNVPFFRIVINTGTGVSARLVPKREKL